MLQRIKQAIYDKIAGSQLLYDLFCDIAEEVGIFEDKDTQIPTGRRRRRRRRRRR